MDTKKDGGNEKCLKGKKKFCEKKNHLQLKYISIFQILKR